MALADLDALLDALKTADFSAGHLNGGSGRADRLNDLWRVRVPTAGGTASTAATTDKTTAGAMPIPNVSSGRLTLIGAEIGTRYGTASTTMLLVDRLSHSGGLSGTVTTAQTTNLPTAALTRYTSGEGVMMAILIQTGIGGTATTISVSYTNSAGTSGRTSPSIPLGGNNQEYGMRVIILPLEVGDTGVRSVESVTLAATTGAAGDFGIVLFRPIALAQTAGYDREVSINPFSGQLHPFLAEVHADACLNLFGCLVTTNATGTYLFQLAEV